MRDADIIAASALLMEGGLACTAMMLPQELKAMGSGKEVFLYEGIPHPVMCDKIRYYQGKYFTSRLLAKADVPRLQV